MKEHIQRTSWALSKETSETFNELGMAQFTQTSFIYGKKEQELNVTSTVTRQSAWAQEFLEKLYIGNVYSLYGHYDTSGQYPKFDLIIDLSEFSQDYTSVVLDENHHTITIEDNGTNFSQLLESVRLTNIFEKITKAREEKKKVLINCQMGMSRSATFAILYMMETYAVSFIQAYRHLQKHRPIVEPNPGYFSALCHYEASLTVEPVPYESAKSWLMEFVSHPDSFEVKKKADEVTLQVKRDMNELGNAFIDLVSFLRMLKIPFTLLNCDSRTGDIQISLEDYEQLQYLFTQQTLQKRSDRID